MVEIATISQGASSSLLYDIHHIARLVLRLIGEDQRIASKDEEACDTPTWHVHVRKGCHETVDFKPD